MKNKIIPIVAVVALVLATVCVQRVYFPRAYVSNEGATVGAIGTNAIENYVPAILYNEGYYSALPIQTTSSLTAASVVATTITVGANGTQIAGIKAGSCTIWAPANTIVASTTQQVECQSATNGTLVSGLTGVTADSICNVTNASSTNTVSNSIDVAGVSASSTAGSIVARISNLTGGTFTWSAAASSSSKWQYTCVDPA